MLFLFHDVIVLIDLFLSFPELFFLVGPVAVTVPVSVASITVTITVTISIAVAVAAAVGVGAVENEGYVVEFPGSVHAFYLREQPAVDAAGADDEQSHVRDPVHDGGVGDDAHRYAVGNDVVVSAAQVGE